MIREDNRASPAAADQPSCLLLAPSTGIGVHQQHGVGAARGINMDQGAAHAQCRKHSEDRRQQQYTPYSNRPSGKQGPPPRGAADPARSLFGHSMPLLAHCCIRLTTSSRLVPSRASTSSHATALRSLGPLPVSTMQLVSQLVRMPLTAEV